MNFSEAVEKKRGSLWIFLWKTSEVASNYNLKNNGFLPNRKRLVQNSEFTGEKKFFRAKKKCRGREN